VYQLSQPVKESNHDFRIHPYDFDPLFAVYLRSNQMCKFLHIRNTEAGQVTGKGGLTVAYSQAEGNLYYAVARCSSRENFCRKIGRAVSRGRLAEGKGTVLPIGESEKAYDVLLEAISNG
jgi:hypothetical protein